MGVRYGCASVILQRCVFVLDTCESQLYSNVKVGRSGKKRVYRLYKKEGLEVRTKKGKKRAAVARVPLAQAQAPIQGWSAQKVIAALENVQKLPQVIIVDNGPVPRNVVTTKVKRQFAGRELDTWPTNTASTWISSDPESQLKMATSRASTGSCAMNSLVMRSFLT